MGSGETCDSQACHPSDLAKRSIANVEAVASDTLESTRSRLAQLMKEVRDFYRLSLVAAPKIDELVRLGVIKIDLVFDDGRMPEVSAELRLFDDGFPRLVLAAEEDRSDRISVVFGRPVRR